MITRETATDIARLHADIESCENLLADLKQSLDKMDPIDIRDVFGRKVRHIEMGVPSGDASRRIFYVPADIAVVVIEATIASHRAKIAVLNEKAKAELAVAK